MSRRPIWLTVPYRSVFPKKDYKLPKEWVGLTDEEIQKVIAEVSQIPPIDFTTTTYARAVEAKLKEKNS
jgi:hypothetical protein